MSVDLDDPWGNSLAAEPSGTASSSSSLRGGRGRAVSAPHQPPPLSPPDVSVPDFDDAWSPTSPLSPLNDTKGSLPRRAGESRSATASPKPNTVRGKAAKPATGLSRSAGPSKGPPRSASHPLALESLDSLSIASDTDVSDISRPALKRVTSITERQVAESQSQSRAESRCGSEVGSSSRGSVDLAHAEVEVIVHQIKPNESLAGIALRYGIELALLRKVNKLWASDSIHLRTHLYIPLEACKPTSKGDQIVRGPGEGQVTIIPHKRHANGATAARAAPAGARNGAESGEQGHSRSFSAQSWGSGHSYNGTIRDEPRRPETPDTITGVVGDNSSDPDGSLVLDIVRLPASQLRFFPRGKREAPASRASLDSDIGRSADTVRTLSSIERARRREARAADRQAAAASRNLTTSMFAPLGALTAAAEAVVAPKKNVVRLRPPQAPAPRDDSFAGQLKSLFTVPPPPVYPVPTRTRATRVTRSEHASQSDGSVRQSVSQVVSVQVEMEMDAGPWGNPAGTPPRTLRKTDKKRD